MRQLTGLFLAYACVFISLASLASAIPEQAADFEALRGENFKVIQTGKGGKQWSKAIDLELTDVSKPVRNGPVEQFTVRFKGTKSVDLAKTVYHFENIKTGEFTLFLEPAGEDKKFNNYQAIFNLLKQK